MRPGARPLLEARGYEVVGVVGDGRRLLAAARRLCPQAVLLDVNLPDADGLTLIGELCTDDYAPGRPGSTLDAWSLGRSVEASGARGFLPKADLGSPRLVELLGPPDDIE